MGYDTGYIAGDTPDHDGLLLIDESQPQEAKLNVQRKTIESPFPLHLGLTDLLIRLEDSTCRHHGDLVEENDDSTRPTFCRSEWITGFASLP